MKKGWIIGGIVGAALLAAVLIFIMPIIGVAGGVITAIVCAYGGVTFVSQMFWADVVPDCMDFFIRSFNMPGIIFELDIDGCMWFIAMKVLLWVLGIALALLAVLLAFVVGMTISVFVYPYALIKNIRYPEKTN
jgi:hypothetical protein